MDKRTVIPGLMMAVMGAAFMVGNALGYPLWQVFRFLGPASVIAMGVYFLFQQGFRRFPWPLFVIWGGIAGLASSFGYWQLPAFYSGPVSMIIVGSWFLFGRRNESR